MARYKHPSVKKKLIKANSQTKWAPFWTVPKIWENQECWILGGGPSLTEQFQIPKTIVDQVRAGELPPAAYNPYLEQIHKKCVIGINIAMFFGGWVDIGFFGDNKFYEGYKKYFDTVSGLIIGCAPILSKVNVFADWEARYVKYIKIHRDVIDGICGNPSYVYWNRNSGAAAISLCHHLGVKRIVLVGFDMTLNDKQQQHWHGLYPKAATLPFGSHMRGFDQISIDAKRMGIEILNASPNSKITQFKKVSVKELL
jgi:hypothetical protein